MVSTNAFSSIVGRKLSLKGDKLAPFWSSSAYELDSKTISEMAGQPMA
jgi:hypothetical protein